MKERYEILHEQFLEQTASADFPEAQSQVELEESGLTREEVQALFLSQCSSRHLDSMARVLKQNNHSFYTIGSSGHEGNAAIAKAFKATDPAFLHYRSGAFFIERINQLENSDPVYDILLSLVASSDDPISSGRHKVFGSVPGWIPPQTSTIASHLPKAVGAAMSIQRCKEMKIQGEFAAQSVVLVSFGDASFNHATAQAAFNTACWIGKQSYPLPLVFICEDNGIGISVPTPKNWIRDVAGKRDFWNYIAVDGLNVLDVYRGAKRAEKIARQLKQPVFLHMTCVRLLAHAGSDIESLYRSEQAIQSDEYNDPLLHTARILHEQCDYSLDEIIAWYLETYNRVAQLAKKVIDKPKLTSKQAVMESIIPPQKKSVMRNQLTEQQRAECFANQWPQLTKPRSMAQQINYALTDLMLEYPNIVVFGEDVGLKGGVYHVTADLQNRFSQRRVFDTVLDETTILGTAIGMAHNGFIPIPEIQFLAYFHNAEDQLRGEASTLSFFSSGQYTNPMVIRIAGLAYQKGFGGHFHNDNSFAAIRDIPGVILAIPSNGLDAAKMLRECVHQAAKNQRVVVFLEPIALYMIKDLFEPNDGLYLAPYSDPAERIPLGEIGIYGNKSKMAVVTYGNGVYLSRQAQHELKKQNIEIQVIDCRWLSPLPIDHIIAALKNVEKVLIVDECRRTGSVSEALMTALVEAKLPLKKLERITAEDCFIPLGNAWQTILPSKQDIINRIIELAN